MREEESTEKMFGPSIWSWRGAAREPERREQAFSSRYIRSINNYSSSGAITISYSVAGTICNVKT